MQRNWRMAVFLLVLFTLLGLVWSYTLFSLGIAPGWSATTQYLFFAFFGFTFLLQILRWIFFASSYEYKTFVTLNYVSMGLVVHLFLGALVKDVLILGNFIPSSSHQLAGAVTIAIAALANLIGSWTAIRGPIVRRVLIPHAGLNSERPLRIAQISDLHVGPLIKLSYVEKVVEKVNRLNPDLIAITGDLVDGQVHVLAPDMEPLRKLNAPLGVYYVPGNHEYYWGIDSWIKKVSELGFRVLINEGHSLDFESSRLLIAGVPDESAHQFKSEHQIDTARAISVGVDTELKILLAHQPKTVFKAEAAGFDLMLSGHTHWGQFFPFNFMVGWFNPYPKGLNRHREMHIYVNAGTGFWGPPLRLGVPSEITLLEVFKRPS